MLLLALASGIAVYVAWNLGANDVANSMGTSVGSGALTLGQAIIIAGLLEFAGAILFGQRVSTTLAVGVVPPALFATSPATLMLGMLAVLLTCGLWLQLATGLGVPVASSHAVVGASVGFGWAALGTQAINWSQLGPIALAWGLTPLLSGAIALALHSLLQTWILQQPQPLRQLTEWIPWLNVLLVGLVGTSTLPSLVASLPTARLGLPAHDVALGLGAIAIALLTMNQWRQLRQLQQPQQLKVLSAPAPAPTLAAPSVVIEQHMARLQILSACCVAFAHGSNDVGNAVAPLAAIALILANGTVPTPPMALPLWVLVLGGLGIVAGLAVWGRAVIATVGEKIIALRPSGGFCAELATAATVLLASRLGLPVSTSQALVGAVIGIGISQWLGAIASRPWLDDRVLRTIGLTWLLTIPATGGLAALIFVLLRQLGTAWLTDLA